MNRLALGIEHSVLQGDEHARFHLFLEPFAGTCASYGYAATGGQV
jgi:hypothetical protein